MNNPIIRQCVKHMVLMAALTPSVLMAQETPRLSLFESVDSQGSSQNGNVTVVAATPANNVQFVLVGTSQIGDKHKARLRTPDGQTVTLDLDPSGRTPVPGYPGYEISSVGARELEIRHPANAPCMPNREQGVSCTGTHQARLQLATAAPVVRQQPANAVQVETVEGVQVINAEGNPPPENPFAAALRAARERGEVDPAAAREGARFRPRRIDPSEVPPGARLVRTPFGDRIVAE